MSVPLIRNPLRVGSRCLSRASSQDSKNVLGLTQGSAHQII